MSKATIRNTQFATLVSSIKELPSGKAYVIAQAFAESHGLKFQFDTDHFELWSKSFSRKPIFSVKL